MKCESFTKKSWTVCNLGVSKGLLRPKKALTHKIELNSKFENFCLSERPPVRKWTGTHEEEKIFAVHVCDNSTEYSKSVGKLFSKVPDGENFWLCHKCLSLLLCESIHTPCILKNERDCFPVKPFINPGGSLDLVCTHSFLAPDLEYVKSTYKSRGKMEKAKDFRGYPLILEDIQTATKHEKMLALLVIREMQI